MSPSLFSHEAIVQEGKFSAQDMTEIMKRRRAANRLGYAYQLAFVRLANRFPTQQPLEIDQELLTYVSMQLSVPEEELDQYQNRQQTLAEHRKTILAYLEWRRFGEIEERLLAGFIFEEASRIEQAGPLLVRAKQFLKDATILFPADDTLRRLIARQRQSAQDHIYARVTEALSVDFITQIEKLLEAGDYRLTLFQALKKPPGRASPAAMLRLTDKLKSIQDTGVLQIDLGWLNNNYQRSLARYARRCSADRMRRLKTKHRYTVLVCFLRQVHRESVDHMIDMHHKLMLRVHNRAKEEMDDHMRRQRRMIRNSLSTFRSLAKTLLDDSIQDADIRHVLFKKVDRENLTLQMDEVENWLTGKYSHVFNLVVQRFSYLRQFAPTFLGHLDFRLEDGVQSSITEAIHLLKKMNTDNKRKLPEGAPLDFIPKKIQPLVQLNGEVSKPAWECALLTAVRDEIRAGNIYVDRSNRFGRFDDFFITDDIWGMQREGFFKRAGLPADADQVPALLGGRLNLAFDAFLESLPANAYANISDKGWQLSSDPAEKLDAAGQQRLEILKSWLSENMRRMKLPELLIDVDNELAFTNHFMTPSQDSLRDPAQICTVLATIMAHGCNIGPYTMAQLTQGIRYREIKWVTDWQLTEEAQRQALAQLVNALSRLDVSQAWGQGTTSSSDGQRFRLRRKLLQQTYSPRFRDYALEFYSFVADNYAPFYSTIIECTDRDAAFVLDGLLYNESDLALDEHFTDTHGYTEVNFAAFAMLGRRFAPRIRGLQKQRLYRIDRHRDYGPLAALVGRRDRTIRMDWICEQWDRMGQFYASLEQGHVTASTALKRLAGYSGKNQFYRANRELGRIFKTEHILQYMSDPVLRRRIQRGLLKSEEVHALARQVAYGKQGTLLARDMRVQRNTASCLTLIMACIIYWQAKEINRVIVEGDLAGAGVDLSLLEHISPVGWENITLYGEYVLNPKLIR
ncbi:MAG: Tn3 family transposase [Chloroflexi bacterium]|nr:MAG: Tn3 family transposase [Chloroflexota bacterium]MBL1195134.1 Tn3 family transposase [Chloroflexota bacterium]NOH12419.1 Tn3 family transposase [Chloroflexota bacterium]